MVCESVFEGPMLRLLLPLKMDIYFNQTAIASNFAIPSSGSPLQSSHFQAVFRNSKCCCGDEWSKAKSVSENKIIHPG